MIWQDDSLHVILGCKTTVEIFQFLQLEARRLGMQNVSWVMKFSIPVLDRPAVIFNTYPKTWEQKYLANDYLSVDPTVQHCLNSVLPMVWSDSALQAVPEFWEEARMHGLYEGIALPVWDRQGCCSMLSLSRDSLPFSRTELLEKIPKVAWLSQLVHSGMSRLILPKEVPESAVTLSPREKEVLKLVAAGLTSHDVAARLHITKRTADFHIEAAAGKIGAENRTDAAVKGIVLGLV